MPLTDRQFAALLPEGLEPNNLQQRRFRGQVTLAGREPFDAFALRLVQALATAKITLSEADRMVADGYAMLTDAVAVAELPGSCEDRPAIHIYFVIFDLGDSYSFRVGGLDHLSEDAPAGTRMMFAVSIDRLLADLKRDAERIGVALPEKLVPAYGSDEYLEWRRRMGEEARFIEAKRAWAKRKKTRESA